MAKNVLLKNFMFAGLLLLALSAFACSDDGGELIDGDASDGDTSDGDIPDGDGVIVPDGDVDGDTPDGDQPDGDIDGDADGDEDGDGTVLDVDLSDGTYTVSFDAAQMTLVLTAPERGELVRLDADSLIFGLVDEVDPEESYDPLPIITDDPIYNPPESLRWVGPEAMAITTKTEDSVTIGVTYPDGVLATLNLEVLQAGNFKLQLVPTQNAQMVAYYRLRATIDDAEGLYGMGEYFDDVNHRGKIRAMQLNFDLTIESGYNEAHIPIPFVTGTRGWGLFTECPYPGAFEIALGTDDVPDTIIQATFGPGPYADQGFIIHLFADEHPLDINKHYYDVTGYPEIPARWALGPWVWRDEVNGSDLPYYGQELVESDLTIMRDEDLACTGYWIDRPYARSVNSFDWDPALFDDAGAAIDLAHDLGYRVAIWQAPYIDSDDAATADLHQTATDNGYYPLSHGLLANGWGNLIDFTNPDAYDWWQEQMSFYTDMGIEGFKLDYAEDVIPGLYGARNVWEFYNGEDERTMHHFYQYWYHKVHSELLPEDGGFLICRSSCYGDQIHASVIWPGDLDANMSQRGELIEGDCDDKRCIGGMPASMIAGLTLGNSGFPFYGADTGGYVSGPVDRETFMRWYVQTALSSVMQVGSGNNVVPWEFTDDDGVDDELLDSYREFARLHLRLWPYEWTYAQKISETGHPIQRTFGIQHPELADNRWDEYFFGDDLLVAPVIAAGVVERDVAFPAGKWINWFTGVETEGPTTITEPAPLGTLPLYLRAGGIVPLLRPTIDTIGPVAAEYQDEVDSYDTTPGRLYPVVFAGDATTFTLFDGATLSQEATATGLSLGCSDGEEFKYGVTFTVIGFGDGKPSGVTLDDGALAEAADEAALDAAESGWLFVAERGGALVVKVPAGTHAVAVTR